MPQPPANTDRLAVAPARLFLPAPGDEAQLQVIAVLADGTRLAVTASFSVAAPAICRVDADGKVVALADGTTDITVAAPTGTAAPVVVPVTVGADILMVEGLANGSLWGLRSTTLQAADLSIPVGNDRGVADVRQAFGRVFLTESSFTRDALRVFDAESLVPVGDVTLAQNPVRYAQQITFVSDRLAYIPLQLPDANGVDEVLVVDVETLAIVDSIALPPGPPLGHWPSSVAVWQDRIFVGGTPFDAGSFAFQDCYVLAIDRFTHDVIDIDLATPATVDGRLLPAVNPRQMFMDDRGCLVVVCAGDGLADEPGSVVVLDPFTLEILHAFSLGQAGNAGAPPVRLHDGTVYLPDQYESFVHSYDSDARAMIRDHSHAIGFGPAYHLGFAGAVRSQFGRVILANPYAPRVVAFDPEDDDDIAPWLPVEETAQPNWEPGHLVNRVPPPDCVYADEIVAAMGLPAGSDPQWALGPPHGEGRDAVGPDVLAMGTGSITVGFAQHRLTDGPGNDFVVFGAATYRSTGLPPQTPPTLWREMRPGTVEVSQDGLTWHAFPTAEDVAYDPADPRRWAAGFFDVTPVYQAPGNGITPRLLSAGGDRFDLQDVGLGWIKYLRLTGTDARLDAIAGLWPVAD